MPYIKHYFFLVAIFLFNFAFSNENGSKPIVLVSIAPYKYFVERIADGTVQANLIVPTGVSEHTFEPTAKALINAGKADLWFRIGEPFEDRMLKTVKSYNPKMRIVDLREGITPIISHEGHAACHHADCRDPHIWLSPKEGEVQAAAIAKALSAAFPQHETLYRQNLALFEQDLKKLDQEIASLFKDLKQRTIMVSHPAYAYLARDYGFTQLPVEFEGREPSPQQLTKLLQTAHKLGIKTVFTQPQQSSKGARLVAKELNAKVIELDPLAEDYINNLRHIAKSFSSP